MPTRNIVPQNNNEGNIGTNYKQWAGGYFQTLYADDLNIFDGLLFTDSENGSIALGGWTINGDNLTDVAGYITAQLLIGNGGGSYIGTLYIDDLTNLQQIYWAIGCDGSASFANGMVTIDSYGNGNFPELFVGEVYSGLINFDATGATYVGNGDGVYVGGSEAICFGNYGSSVTLTWLDNAGQALFAGGSVFIANDGTVTFANGLAELDSGGNLFLPYSSLYADGTINGVIFQSRNTYTNPALNANEGAWYMKETKFVVSYRDGSTVKYRYMDLTSTNANWTYSTTAP
jgi:hypothetical protein